MDPRKLKIGDLVWIYLGERISPRCGNARFLLGLDAGGKVARDKVARGKVIGIKPIRGREGADTPVYVELEDGKHGVFRYRR